MSLVYVEFRSRRSNVSPTEYSAWFGRSSGRVSGEDEPDDRLLYNIARTWRLGPGPDHVMIYHTPDYGLERLDHWQKVWTSDDPRLNEISSRSAELGVVEEAGCYRLLRDPVLGHPGPFYLESFSAAAGGSDGDILTELNEPSPDTPLLLAMGQRGLLAPPPGGLALWGLPNFGALDLFTRDRDHREITIHSASVLAALGSEVI